MKRIKYLFNIPVNKGTEENPVLENCLFPKSLPYSPEAEEIAKREAYKGEYTIIDDGQPDIVNVADDVDNMLVDHEYRLTMLELGM